MAAFGSIFSSSANDTPKPSLMSRLRAKTKLLATTGIFSVLFNIGTVSAKNNTKSMDLKNAQVKAMQALLKAEHGMNWANDGSRPDLEAVLDGATFSGELKNGVNAVLGEELSDEQLYEKAVSNPNIDKELEEKAYETVREMAQPKLISPGIRLVAPLGDSFDDMEQSSKVGWRKLKMDKGRKTFHTGNDFKLKGTTGATMGLKVVKNSMTGIVGNSGITNRGGVGYIEVKSLDGHHELTYNHIYTLNELAKFPKEISAEKKRIINNPKTGIPYKRGDTIYAGQPLTLIHDPRSGERSEARHLDIKYKKDGVKIKNDPASQKIMNNLLASKGVLVEDTYEETKFTKHIGWYASQGLLHDKTVEEMKARVAEENQKKYGKRRSNAAVELKGAYEFRHNKLNYVASVIKDEKKKEFKSKQQEDEKRANELLHQVDLIAMMQSNMPLEKKGEKQEHFTHSNFVTDPRANKVIAAIAQPANVEQYVASGHMITAHNFNQGMRHGIEVKTALPAQSKRRFA